MDGTIVSPSLLWFPWLLIIQHSGIACRMQQKLLHLGVCEMKRRQVGSASHFTVTNCTCQTLLLNQSLWCVSLPSRCPDWFEKSAVGCAQLSLCACGWSSPSKGAAGTGRRRWDVFVFLWYIIIASLPRIIIKKAINYYNFKLLMIERVWLHYPYLFLFPWCSLIMWLPPVIVNKPINYFLFKLLMIKKACAFIISVSFFF